MLPTRWVAPLVVTVFLLAALLAAGGASRDTTASEAAQSTAPGEFMAGLDLGLTPEQLAHATISMRMADELHAPPLPVLAMVVSALGESGFLPIPNGQGSGYCGVFQADPANIPCSDTQQQARYFLIGGKGFQRGGAIYLAEHNPDMSPGTIATLVEASGQPGSFYDVHRPQAEKIIAAWRSGSREFDGGTGSLPDVDSTDHLTPKQIIDRYVLPIARHNGIPVTAASVEAANAAHSTYTTDNNVSDHKGPPGRAWAADMSDNWVTTVGSPNMTRLAAALAKMYAIPGWLGSGLVNNERAKIGACYYRLQLIYLTGRGGNHYNHVHFGVRLLGC